MHFSKEIENMKNHEVYECVPYIDQKSITRWVITEKYEDKIMKAYLIACGYEEDSSNLKQAFQQADMHLIMLIASVISL